MAKKLKSKLEDIPDFIFTFRYCDIDVNFTDNEIFTEKEQQKIFNIVNQLSKEIVIDKSYVEFPENKHEKVFILEQGWNEFCKLIYDTKFNKRSKKSKQQLDEYYKITYVTYTVMIENYLYGVLADYGFDLEFISLSLKEHSYFSTEVEIDNIHAWKYYKGPWQNW